MFISLKTRARTKSNVVMGLCVKLQARQYMYVIAELRINGSGTVLV